MYVVAMLSMSDPGQGSADCYGVRAEGKDFYAKVGNAAAGVNCVRPLSRLESVVRSMA